MYCACRNTEIQITTTITYQPKGTWSHLVTGIVSYQKTPPSSNTYQFLRGNLQDAFLEKGSGLGTTFYKIAPTLRIDVCLPDNRLQVLQCTVPQLYLSDHFPVVTDLAWKKE